MCNVGYLNKKVVKICKPNHLVNLYSDKACYCIILQQRIRQRCRRQLGYDVELPPLPPEATEDGPVSIIIVLFICICILSLLVLA